MHSDNFHHRGGKHGKEVHHFEPREGISALEILKEFDQMGVFGGGSLGKAFRILTEAKRNGAKVNMSLAGAMIPGGMRKTIVRAIEYGLVDMLVTTGANCTHDLIEAFGHTHLKHVSFRDDNELRERGVDRVYDAFVHADGFPTLEDNIQKLIIQMHDELNIDGILHTSSHEILRWLGEHIDDEQSFIRAAYKHGVPIFVPALSDSVLGLQIWLRSQFKKIIIDEMRDLGEIQTIFHEADSNAAFILGGGVPKNYMLQSSLMSDKEYEYGVAVTMDRVETGGLSGATLTEAVSWGKFTWEAPKTTVYADTTIVLPLIVSAWMEHISADEKK